jgi:hypothetical protein
MTVRPPPVRTSLDASAILTGAAVRGLQGQSIARLSNQLLASGWQLVPIYAPRVLLDRGTTSVLNYRIWPRYQTKLRWVYLVASSAEEGGSSIGLSINGDTQTEHSLLGSGVAVPIVRGFTVSARSSTETALTVEVECLLTPGEFLDDVVTLHWIGVAEAPRTELQTSASDYGTDGTQMVPSQPVTRTQLSGAIQVLGDATRVARRHVLNWARPDDDSDAERYAVPFTSTSYVDVFGLGVPVLGRQIARGATTATVTGKIYGYVSGGATFNVRLTSSENGNGSAVSFTSATPAWSSAMTCTVDCEDLSTASGLRSGDWDLLNVDIRRTAGTGTLYLLSASAVA